MKKNKNLELFKKPSIHIILIITVGLLAYSNTFNVPFHFDDTLNIVENSNIKNLSNFWPPSGSRWFGFLTFALNYHFGGLNTIGYHIVNLAIHIFNALLVYLLVVLTFRTPYFMVRHAHHDATVTLSHEPVEWSKGHHSPIHPFSSASGGQAYLPLFIALLFVSHPIQTQAVTYIVQRFTSLATMFYLLSLVMYIKFRIQQSAISPPTHPSPSRGEGKGEGGCYTLYAVSLVSAVLAMKTKEISFTLPVIIVLFEFMFFEGNIKKRMLYLIPILLTMLIIPLSMISIDKPLGDVFGELREAAQETDKISRWSYLFTELRVVITYIRLLFLPVNQNLAYYYPIYHSFLHPSVFLSFLFLLSILDIGIYLFYRSREKAHISLLLAHGNNKLSAMRYERIMAFGIFWFFITLLPESSFIPIKDVIFEHRLYLPSVGLFIAIMPLILTFANSLKEKWSRLENVAFLAPALIIIVLTGATYARNIFWCDEISLWKDVISKSPKMAGGYYNLGLIYYNKSMFDESIAQYQLALKLKPDFIDAHFNLGSAYGSMGLTDNAINHFQIALKLKPDHIDAHLNLGFAYYNKGMLDESIAQYQLALKLKPDYIDAHFNLGNTYNAMGLIDKAIEHYQIALKLKPDFADAHFCLGLIYLKTGGVEKARKEFEITLKINPGDYQAQQLLNSILNPNNKTSPPL